MTPEELASLLADAENNSQDKTAEAKSTAEKIFTELTQRTWDSSLFTAPIALRLVKLLRRLEDKKRAQEVLDKSFAAYPQNADFVRQQYNLYATGNKYDVAFAWSQDTIRKEPPVTNEVRLAALISAGAALRNLRRFDEARKKFGEALSASGGTATGELLLEQGWLSFYEKSYDEAFKKFNEALSKLSDEELRSARVGLLASQRQLDLVSPDSPANARQLVDDWRKTIPDAEVFKIFVTSQTLLAELNLYPAVLASAEHLLEIDKDNVDGVYLKIAALKWLRRYEQAKDVFAAAPAKVQADLEIWNEHANVYYEQKRFKEAHLLYTGKVLNRSDLTPKEQELKKEKLIERLNDSNEAREWTIVSLRQMRQFVEARNEVTTMLKTLDNKPDSTDDNKVSFWGESGAIYYAQRKYDKAIEEFDQVLAINPYETFALQWRIASFRKQGKLDKATDELNQALAKVPYATRLWEEAGWVAFDKEEYEEAIKHFDKASELDPYVIKRQFAKIEALIRLNRANEALDVLKQLDKQFPNDAEIMEQHCWFHLRFGDVDAASQFVSKLRDLHGESALALNARGGYELAMRNYTNAARAFTAAIGKVNYEPQYYVNLASTVLRQVKPPNELQRLDRPRNDDLIGEAILHCEKALDLDPLYAKAWGCRGVIAFMEDKFIDAEAYFRKSIRLSPDEGSHVELASLYCQMGRFDEATAELKTALKLNPRDARAYIELATIAVSTGDNKEAIRYCRQAVLVEPRNRETHRALAVALLRGEQYEEAELRLREALNNLSTAKPWRLRLLLVQILVRAGDTFNQDRKKKDPGLYEEALSAVNAAQNECGPNAELLFHAGIVQQRLEDYDASLKSFAECVKLNPQRYDAERYARIVETALRQQRRHFVQNQGYGIVLAVISSVLLATLWLSYFLGHQRIIAVAPAAGATATAPAKPPEPQFTVDQSLLNVMTPILLGLLTISALLPNLSKLKLPGFEADINDPKSPDPDISTGPRGDIKFGSSIPITDLQPK